MLAACQCQLITSITMSAGSTYACLQIVRKARTDMDWQRLQMVTVTPV